MSPPAFQPELLTESFWFDQGIHVACPPLSTIPSISLIESARPHLPEGGCLFLTSGTTAAPKWVALEKRAFLHSARVVNAHYDLGPKDSWLIALPLHHVGGFSILARAFLTRSTVTFTPSKWNTMDFYKSLIDSNITVTSIVPTQLHDLVAHKLSPPESLRLVLVGGGLLNPTLFLQALDLRWPVRATYGMTETASQVASQSLEHDSRNDPETLEVLPLWDASTSADGALILRGPALAKGYLSVNSSDIEWLPISSSTGLHTRDRVLLRSDGTRSFLQFLGRHEDCVKIVGELISLVALEKRFSSLLAPSAPTFAIVPIPDLRREHRLVLAVESFHSSPPDYIFSSLETFNTECPPFERIESVTVIPQFPRTELGKLSRAALVALVTRQTNRAASSPPTSET